jgi:cysteine sulfinate desulfinase/cysteine desulfurase-like protein
VVDGACDPYDRRDLFWDLRAARFGDRVVLNGHPEYRLPNTLDVSFVGLVGADILAALEGVAASTGSACHAGSIELSPVLRAIGISPEVGMGAIRFSLGRSTTEAEIRTVVEAIDEAISAGVGRLAAPLAAAPFAGGMTRAARWPPRRAPSSSPAASGSSM